MTSGAHALGRVYSRAVAACFRRCEPLYYRWIRRAPTMRRDPGAMPHLLGAGCDSDEVFAACRELFPHTVEAKVHQADLICDHVFDLLGSGPVRLTSPGIAYRPIDWHCDFKSGYRWSPRQFHRRIQYDLAEGVDIKVPWELSRFQHLNTLGQAYALTGNGKYATEFVNQIDDWIASNPVGFGVNWKCTMDVAIRAASWLIASEYFRAGNALMADFLRRFRRSIHEHAGFIFHHLERGQVTTNHYLSDIVGLLFIAVYCPFFRESRRWFSFCVRELAREMDTQVHPDGCDFESSTCYHRLALESFFFAAWLVAVNEGAPDRDRYHRAAERVLGSPYVERLRAMFIAALHLVKPNGRMPQIGDNDSGRFQVFTRRDVLDVRYLLPLGAIFFEEPSLKMNEFGFTEDIPWIFGRRGYNLWTDLDGRSLAGLESTSFPDAGWYVMRHGYDYCLVSCGRNSPPGKGGHAHNDKLSFELALGGQDVVVDPGTYAYTSYPRLRNKFRSTDYHNTVKVDGCEQNELADDVFSLPDRVNIGKAHLVQSAGRIRFEGEIEYAGFAHSRTITADSESGTWRIDDRISCSGSVGARVLYHLSPDVVVHGTHIIERGTRKPVASIEVQGDRLQVHTYDYSPQYGVSVEAPCLCIRVPDPTRTAQITTIFAACDEARNRQTPAPRYSLESHVSCCDVPPHSLWPAPTAKV